MIRRTSAGLGEARLLARLGTKVIAGLLAATSSAAATAQGAAKPAVSAPPASAQRPSNPASTETAPPSTQAAGDAAPPEGEFTGADGEPLPPEKQRELRELFKKNPPPVTRRRASQGTADGGIVVTGRRPRGSVIGDIPPEQTFNPLDIKAYGSGNIGELLNTLGPQVSSNQGRVDNGPVVLLNGKRVSSFAEISNIPTEAIERMEVFPEELALKYGYRADQKVVNVVTFERFSSRIGRVAYTIPTEGGRDTAGINVNYLRISGDTRLSFDADYDRSGSLLESERDVLQIPEAPDSGRFRTLLPEAERLALNGTVSGNLLSGVSSTLNGRFEANRSDSLLGLGFDGPLTRNLDTRATHLGTSLGGRLGKWPWSFTANYDRTRTKTFTDTNAARRAQDETRSVNSLADAELVLSGSFLKLPAGPVSTSFRAGGERREFTGRSLRGGVEQTADLSRNRAAVQANIDVPIASRSRKVLTWLGDFSANVNLAIEQLSDFGTLRAFGYGLNWSPIGEINLIASVTNEEGAPTVEQLGAPLVETPNVRTFDFTRREVIDITRVSGGNPSLGSDSRHVVKLGVNARPIPKTDFTLSVEYTKTRIEDPIATFPIATPEIETAFPGRFTRDVDGQLLRIDSRPLSFNRSDQERIRWGLNFTRPLGPVPPGFQNATPRFAGSEADLQKALPPGARIIKPEAGSPAAREFENVSSRLTLSFYYTWNLVDEIRTSEGGPVLDLLNGSATAARGGSPRHQLEFQAGAFKRGLGARLTINWQSGTIVRGLSGTTGGSSGNLNFSDYTAVNINLFANLERVAGGEASNWLKGTRVSIGINNLFSARPGVRDDAGLTPLSYQPAYLDPLGRLVNFSLRKVF